MDINPPKLVTNLNTLILHALRLLTVFSCTEAARCYPIVANAPSHDSFTRLLQRQTPDTEALWEEVKNHVKPKEGFLIVDDSTLDKPYGKRNGLLVRPMWSGKHHRTVKGMRSGYLSLDSTVQPLYLSIFEFITSMKIHKTKNDHFTRYA